MNTIEQATTYHNKTDETCTSTDKALDCTLTDEVLDGVVGEAYRFVRAVAYSGVKGTDTNLGTNGQLWITSAT